LILNALLPWNLHVARRLNRYKGEIDRSLPQWLEVWFELEALGSLAGFAYLNPENAFPEIIAATEAQVIFEANALGHPLIPYPERVCNDFSLAGPGSIDLITGSNMSGKSTFLRTVGVNLRLAYAGGPVNATACRLSLLRLFSCLNVSDSVTDGISYFYAEVKRLRALLDELDQDASCPLLYLIDEIFRGTNNRERYLGSQAYIRALAGKSGMGLIATHDLELVKLADELPQLKNYHFRETVANGRMLFDYRLRPGPCPTTNALKIMELEGLPVRH
jgi:DNA mismatch repair ATPase MutS